MKKEKGGAVLNKNYDSIKVGESKSSVSGNAHRRSNNSKNKGFSLVEVLIGVMILGIIVSPLLHSFVTAAGTSAKGRKMHNATLAASNLLETVDSHGLDKLVADVKAWGGTGITLGGLASDGILLYSGDESVGYTPLDASELDELGQRDPKYTFGVKNLRYSDSGAVCDAVIVLDATLHSQNSKEVAKYTSMDGVYSQPAENGDNPDYGAAYDFSQEAEFLSMEYPDLGLPYWSLEKCYYEMDRDVVITITKVPDTATTGIIVATVEMSYEVAYDGTYPLTSTLYTNDFYREPYNDADIDAEAKSLYFFYYPKYKVGSGGNDKITIVNEDNVKVNIFIVKQKAPTYLGLSSGAITTAEMNYDLSLNLVERLSGSLSVTNAKLYSNLTTNIGDGTTYTSAYVQYSVRSGSWAAHNLPVPRTLVHTEARNRLYTVTVELFEPGGGSGFAPGESILKMEATSIE